ncbi:hypothetical protein Pelo_7881 [Pelomyxa schiedti]|nr:hypothetical protein Pelo_7881 [Pelomyxa schiedti]
MNIPNTNEHTTQQQHREVGLGEVRIVQGVWAAEQVVALALASHSPRCGADSPARALGPHLVKQLWDSCVLSCLRPVVLDVSVAPYPPSPPLFGKWRLVVRLTLSPLLLGLVGAVHVAPREAEMDGHAVNRCQRLDETLCCVERGTSPPGWQDAVVARRTGPWGGAGGWSGRERRLLPSMDHVEVYVVNREWMLQRVRDGAGFSLVVRSLRGVGGDDVEERRGGGRGGDDEDEAVVIRLPEYRYLGRSFEFSKAIPSHAVMIVDSGNQPGTTLLVLDVAKTHATRSLKVVSTTHCALTPEWLSKFDWCSVAVMQNRACETVFLIQSSNLSSSSFVHAVQANGDTTQLYCEIGSFPLSQVSESLFSIYHKRTQVLEIWDCSDTLSPSSGATTRRPLRSILNLGKDNSLFTSGGGFIFLVRPGSKQLEVIDGASGNTAVMIEFLAPGCTEYCGYGSILSDVHNPEVVKWLLTALPEPPERFALNCVCKNTGDMELTQWLVTEHHLTPTAATFESELFGISMSCIHETISQALPYRVNSVALLLETFPAVYPLLYQGQFEEIVIEFMKFHLNGFQHLCAGSRSAVLTPEFIGQCLTSEKSIHTPARLSSLQYPQIKANHNRLLFGLLTRRKNRCVQWLFNIFDIPLSDIVDMARLAGETDDSMDITGWHMIVDHCGPTIDGALI